jgi:hypothetical protein
LYLLCTVTAFNEIFGQLQIYQADNFITQHAEIIHVIKGSRSNGNGEYQLVNIDDEMSYDLRSGMLLTVKGHHVAKNTLPNITQIDKGHKLFNVTSIKLHNIEGSVNKRATLDTPPNAVTVRRAVAIIINFTDEKVSCSRDDVARTLWNTQISSNITQLSNKRIYELQSFGKVSFRQYNRDTMDVYGPYEFDLKLADEPECRPDYWSDRAIQMARDRDGVEFSRYEHHIFVLPNSPHLHLTLCKWNGLGNVGCNELCRTWVSNCDNLGVYIHELGHNFGLRHAGRKSMLSGEFVEYGDPTGWMGNQWWSMQKIYQFIAPYRIQLGWIPPEKVLEVSTSGTYTLAPANQLPQNSANSSYMALKIKKADEYNRNPLPYFFFSFYHGENIVSNDSLIVHVNYFNAPTQYVTELRPGEFYRDPAVTFGIRYDRLRIFNKNQAEIIATIHFYCSIGNSYGTVLPHSDYFLPTSLVTTVTGEYPLLSPTAKRSYVPELTLWAADMNNTATTSTTQFIHLRGGASQFNITFAITNSDTMTCVPLNYNFYFSQTSPNWDIQCTPSSLFLLPQQTCNVECQFTNQDSSTALTTAAFKLHLNGSNSYNSTMHNSTLTLGVIFPDTCQKNPPAIVTNSSALARVGGKLTIDVTLENGNSASCEEQQYSLRVLSPDWQYQWRDAKDELTGNITGTALVTLRSQSTHAVQLELTVPDDVSLLGTNVTLTLVMNTTTGDSVPLEVAQQVLVTFRPKCIDGWKPSISVQDVNFQLRAPQGYFTLVTVDNTHSCADIDFDLTSSEVSELPIESLVLSDSLHVEAGTKTTSVLFVSGPTAPDVPAQSRSIAVNFNDNGAQSSTSIEITLTPTTCERNTPFIYVNCPKHVNIEDPKLYVMARGSESGFKCEFWSKNTDSWPCDDSALSVELSSVNTSLNIVPRWSKQQFLLEATNNTWEHVNITMADGFQSVNGSLTNPVPIELTFALRDNSRNRVGYATGSTLLGRCIRGAPNVTLTTASEIYAHAGSTAVFKFDIRSTDNEFCDKGTFRVSIDQEQKDYMKSLGIPISADPTSSNFERGRVYRGSFSVALPVLYNGELNFTVSINATDPVTLLAVTTSINLRLVVNSTCNILPPFVIVNQTDFAPVLRVGAEQEFIVGSLNLTNLDQKTCTNSSMFVSLRPNAMPFVNQGVVAHFGSRGFTSGVAVLQPGEVATTDVFVYLAENAAPGTYEFTISVSDNNEPAHASASKFSVNVPCPIPKPVWNLQYFDVVSELGTSIGTKLNWTACQYPADCCCPCQYEISSNGLVLATVNYTNATIQNTLAQSGAAFEYTLTVIDKNGVRSDPHNCGTSVSGQVSASDLEYLMVFIIFIGVLLLPGLVLLIENVRWHKKMKSSRHASKYQNEFKFAEELAPTTADEL